jgi:hypothetical protein
VHENVKWLFRDACDTWGGSTGADDGGGAGGEKLENKKGKVAKHKQGGFEGKGKEEAVRKSSRKEGLPVEGCSTAFWLKECILRMSLHVRIYLSVCVGGQGWIRRSISPTCSAKALLVVRLVAGQGEKLKKRPDVATTTVVKGAARKLGQRAQSVSSVG